MAKSKAKSKEIPNQQATLRTPYMYVRVSLCTSVLHNTPQNSSDNFPS